MAATITVVCPTCRHKMRASADHVGRQGRCPNCKKLIQIAASGQESVQTLAPVTEARADRRLRGGTQGRAWLAGLIGAGAALLLYVLVFYPLTLKKAYLGELMTERGPIQFAITLVTCWGLAILALKYLAVKRELRSAEMELELIPLEIGLQITPDNVDQFLDHIAKLPPAHQRSILARRIRGALEHFKHRHNVSEVQSYLSSQAELEASAVDSGYTLLRVFIWVCPILGFIGTVTGISDAVTGLAKTLPTASASAEPGQPAPAEPAPEDKGKGGDLGKQMLAGMRTVTGGLAVAFDTTLVGLICVVVLMFPSEALRRTEYVMLDRVEEFANESLLRRMSEESASAGDPEMPRIVREALDAAFKEHQRWLVQWQAQVAKLGEGIGGDFESAVNHVVERLSQAETTRLESVKGAAKAVEEMFAKVNHATDLQASVGALKQLQQSLNANTALMGQFLAQQKQLAEKYASGDLGAVVQSLQQISARLGSAAPKAQPNPPPPTVASVIAPVEPQKSPGLFGRMFGRNDG